MVKCPECDAEIKIPSDSIEGEIVTCPYCGASYELVKSADGFGINRRRLSARTGVSEAGTGQPVVV